MWQREEEFKVLLKKAVTNASKSSIEQLTDLAIADQTWVRSLTPVHSLQRICYLCSASPKMALTCFTCVPQCYKHVCVLVEKQMAKAAVKHRKNVVYVMSSICRQSKARLGSKDKYGELKIHTCGLSCSRRSRIAPWALRELV